MGKNKNYSWVQTHKELVEKLKDYKNRQFELIEILAEAGVEESTIIDEDEEGRKSLEEIDPYDFFCFIYKYGAERRLQILQNVAEIFDIHKPSDTNGVPSTNAQKVMLFPFQSDGRTDEVNRLWELFYAQLNNEISNELFEEILSIKGVGSTKLTEALFNIDPEENLPINSQTRPYLKQEFGIETDFNSFDEYKSILEKVRKKSKEPFYKISHDAWLWESEPEDKDDKQEEVKVKMTDQQRNSLNQILFGPPGTGKTFYTVNKSLRIVDPEFYKENKGDRKALTKRYRELLITDWAESKKRRIAFTTFHQSFTYEDFVEGIKPDVNTEGEISYKIEDGIFKRICIKAKYYSEGEAEEARERVRLSDENFKKAQFFKVSLGNSTKEEDDEIYQYCIDHGKISIGYLDHIDLSGKSESEIKKIVQQNSELSDYSSRAMNYFIHYLKKGHYVLVSKGNTIVRAIGQVTGNYEYKPDAPVHYPHFRDVNWLVKDVEIPVEEIYEKNLQQQPIYMLKKDWVSREFFEKQNVKKVTEGGDENFVLIVDEINRGNIAQIFGELITLIEPDKREGGKEEQKAILPYSKKPFSVPSNLHIIGTMNTADRSIEALDTALRRRFTFEEMPPNPGIIEEEGALKEERSEIKVGQGYFLLSSVLEAINIRIEKLLDKDHLIGHSYFMDVKEVSDLQRVFYRNIIPLLEEYFYGDKGKIQLVLGKGFIKQAEHSGETDVFAQSEYDDSIFEDREVWELTSDWRYNDKAFEEALNLLLKKKA